MTEWGAEQYMRMKLNGISCQQLAVQMGVERTYISKLFRKAHLRDSTKANAENAINSLIKEAVND